MTDTTVDKSGWPAGPWCDEPDRLEWCDADTGYACYAQRNPILGSWCGYVLLPPTHRLYRATAEDLARLGVDAHGSITWTGLVSALKHGPDDAPGDWRAIGFDCAHHGDLVPMLGPCGPCIYRDVAYVRAEVTRLAAALLLAAAVAAGRASLFALGLALGLFESKP